MNGMGRYAFRLRFVLSNLERLPYPGEEHVLHEDSCTVTYLRANGAINDTDQVALIGKAFDTEEEALAAGERWRHRLERAFACLSIGADFGDRAPSGGMTDEGLALMQGASDVVFMNDVHGLMTFDADRQVVFVRASAHGRARPTVEALERALDAAQAAPPVTERERLAYDLFNASQVVAESPEARFVMLVMAIEALIQTRRRDERFCSHIDRLIAITLEASLDPVQAENLTNALRSLKNESVGVAGRRLVASMDGRKYGGQDAVPFFKKCYGMRSALVHGHAKRPSRDEVSMAAAHLESLTGQLIAGRPLVNEVLGAGPSL